MANLRGDDNALSEQDINLLKKIAAKINLKWLAESVTREKNIAELVKINGDFYENLSAAMKNLRDDDNALSEQDINLLKKIAAKINLK